MKRKALLIGNSDGLQGVKKDLYNFEKFLKSDKGGAWNDLEIEKKMNPTKNDLLSIIKTIKDEKNDFVIVVFSGHGAYKKSTILEINNTGDIISENELFNLAKRQISIFDCCRNIIKESFEAKALLQDSVMFSATGNDIRARYNERIMNSIEQQVMLYACSIDESALDTENGGLYTQSLLNSTSPNNGNRFKSINEAHVEAASKTKTAAWIKQYHHQNPSMTSVRCLSTQQLIISIL